MPDLATMLAGFQDALNLSTLFYVAIGVALGQVVGAIPGLSIIMALAIAVPFTYALEPLTAIAFLISVNKGGTVGGAVPAILLNTPGTPESAATALDGHPMARKGRGMKAMKYSLYYSVTGDFASDLVLILVSAPLALIALKMGPVEIACLMVLAFTIITGLVGSSMVKGLVSATLGFLAASVGLDPGTGSPRYTLGYYELDDGFPLAAVAVGMLAVSEIIMRIAATDRRNVAASVVPNAGDRSAENRVSLSEFLANKFVAVRAIVIGTAIGAIPGLGSATAGFLSYSIAKQTARDPEKFGTGDPRGLAASEAANSAVVGANLIPLLTLGIPGNIAAALLVSAFILHGIQPGPLLFRDQGQLIYAMFGAMVLANLCNLVVGQFGMRLWMLVVSAPMSLIYPAALLLCMTGAYFSVGGIYGILIMVGAAAFGCAMRILGYSAIIFIIAFILAPLLERSIIQSMIITRSDPAALLDHPFALFLLLLAVACVAYFLVSRRSARLRSADAVSEPPVA